MNNKDSVIDMTMVQQQHNLDHNLVGFKSIFEESHWHFYKQQTTVTDSDNGGTNKGLLR